MYQSPINEQQPLFPQASGPGYPPNSSPGYQSMSQPPVRKPRRWPWIIAIIVALLIGYAAGNSAHGEDSTTTSHSRTPHVTQTTPVSSAGQQRNSKNTAQSTKPTPTPRWTTTQTIKGNGIKKTAIFSVPDDWKLQWKCNPSSFYGGSYNLMVTVYGADGTMQDLAVNTLCKAGNTTGETEEHSGGKVYLDVNSEAEWTLTIQEMK